MKIKAKIVFDLDGTLVDSAPDIHAIANVVLKQGGYSTITLAQTRNFIGNGAGVLIEKVCDACSISQSEHERLLKSFLGLYNDAVDLTTVYAGVESVLQTLTTQGHSLGVCTNKPIRPALALLDHLNLTQYFKTFWGGDSLPVRKPDPGPLHAAFAALPDGIEIYVGDSDVDAETATRAAVPFLLFTEGYRKQAIDQMDYTEAFSHYRDLPGLVEQMLHQST